MQSLRNRLTVRELALIIALAVGIPSFNLVSAQDPTLQVSQPKTHEASTAEVTGCGLTTIPASESDVIAALYRRVGLLAD